VALLTGSQGQRELLIVLLRNRVWVAGHLLHVYLLVLLEHLIDLFEELGRKPRYIMIIEVFLSNPENLEDVHHNGLPEEGCVDVLLRPEGILGHVKREVHLFV